VVVGDLEVRECQQHGCRQYRKPARGGGDELAPPDHRDEGHAREQVAELDPE
jgi:hypothetical protein